MKVFKPKMNNEHSTFPVNFGVLFKKLPFGMSPRISNGAKVKGVVLPPPQIICSHVHLVLLLDAVRVGGDDN